MKNFLVMMIFFSVFLLIDSFYVDSQNKDDEVIKFIYVSYLEYLNNFSGNTINANKNKIDEMISNIRLNNFNSIILQVSPFSDAIYDSQIFPYSYSLTGVEGKNPGFDYLEYFLKKAHAKKIKVHAWINPYRISSKNDVNSISDNNPAKAMINTENIGVGEKGIYYDPSSELVKKLIEKQVIELIKNYDLDGIHFDDYFYIDYNIDNYEYKQFIDSGNNKTVSEFRLMHTNDLIRRISHIIQKENKKIIFSIAPDGNINNNYKYHYADVKTWIKDNLIDIIMPQLYYGFDNQYLPFEKAYNIWNDLIVENNSNVKMIPVLAFYKVGIKDSNAGTGNKEWLQNGVIEKQLLFLKDKSMYNGFGLFRYDYIFNDSVRNEIGINELNNIRNLCK